MLTTTGSQPGISCVRKAEKFFFRSNYLVKWIYSLDFPNQPNDMRHFTIRKKNGKLRHIYAPNQFEKFALRCLVPRFTEIAIEVCDPDVVHGFMPMRSPVTNADKHIGYQYTLSMDIVDFFDSVKRSELHPMITAHIKSTTLDKMQYLLSTARANVFVDGRLRQGLPTSPILANIAAIGMDKEIKAICVAWCCVYTRYADDLCISSNNLEDIKKIRDSIPAIAKKYGFEINVKKTRIQWAGYGRRIITGVAVDDRAAYPTRKVRRKIRAATHQKKTNVVNGLMEWAALKRPNQTGPKKLSRVQRAIARHVAETMASHIKP